MRIFAFGTSDTGLHRDHNEDSYLLIPSLGLHVVCDGMGGHAAGEVASEMAARGLADKIEKHRDFLKKFNDTPKDREHAIDIVRQAVEETSHLVYERACSDQGRAGMGTTLVTLITLKDKVSC